MKRWCKRRIFRQKTLKKHFLWASLPLLIFGLLFLYSFSTVYTYFYLKSHMNQAADHLVERRIESLVRKTNLAAMMKQINLQEAVYNNNLYTNLFNQVLNVGYSTQFDPRSVWLNFNEFVGKGIAYDLYHCQWYIDPTTFTVDNSESLKLGASLFNLWRATLKDDITRSGLYNSVYYIFANDRMFVQYPGHSTDLFTNWTKRDRK